jgi:putative aldouronate transport system substrate-binding protein
MDRDAAISIRKEGELKFFSGQSFSLSTINIGRLGSNYELFKTANGDISSEESLDFLDIWAAPDGNKYHTVAFPEGGEALISGTVNDEKLERILYILDYMYNDDYLLSCKNGIENIDWKWDNDKVVSLLSPDVTLRSKYVVSTGANFSSLATWGTWLLIGGKTVRNPNPDLGYTTQRNNEWLQYMKTTKKPVEINFQVQLISTPGKDKVGTFDVISDMYTVVMGTGDPVAMWKNVIKSYEARGLTQAVEEVNVETKNLGF